MKRSTKIKCIAGVLALALLPVISLAENDDHGKFTISETSRFYIVTEETPAKTLMATVGTADQQFAAANIPSGDALPIVYGTEKYIEEGDIVVRLETAETEDAATDAAAQTESAPEDDAQTDVEADGTASVDATQMENSDPAAVAAAQAYSIETTSSGTVLVTASGEDGLFYGLDTLLQTFLTEGETIDCSITEAPSAAERVLLLDCGRKYYSAKWIENLIKRMSWQKYTSLELHFSDTKGMRFESKKYPWLNEPEGEYLTFEELEHICKIARKYHVEIIPELDTPGHMDYIIDKYRKHVSAHPDFSFEYDGKTYNKKSKGFSDISNYYVYRGARTAPNNTGIDLSNPVAVAFTRSLIDEYAAFFAEQGSTKFNIGGDELFGWNGVTLAGRSFDHNTLWNALEHWQSFARSDLGLKDGSASDVFITYLNDTAAHLKEQGYTCRVWNDEILRTQNQHVKLGPEIRIVYWSNDYAPMKSLAKKGYKISNANTGWCYYVIRQDKRGGDIMDKTRKHCNAKNIYDNWNPRNCANRLKGETLIPRENFAGGYFAIWGDSPDYKDEATVWKDTNYRTWANSAKLWNENLPQTMSYSEFQAHVKKIGTFPGWQGDCSKANPLPDLGPVEEIKGSLLDRALRWFRGLFGK